MKPTRSLLFVPGHRKGWAEKAVAAGADAIILDLEDSVPQDLKAETRHMVAETIRSLAKAHPHVSIYVRLNALESGMMGDDLELVAIEGCDGFLPPKTYGARDVICADALVTHYERRNGVPSGTLEFILSLETAQAYADCENMLAASPRWPRCAVFRSFMAVVTLKARRRCASRRSRGSSSSDSSKRFWQSAPLPPCRRRLILAIRA